MINFIVKPFEELTNEELYQLLRLRNEVFVVEQNCPYQDLDNKDQFSLHVLGFYNNELVACTRLFAPGDCYQESSIGRVVVKANYRALKFGHALMQFSIEEVNRQYQTSNIKIGAQSYLVKFYNSHGFYQVGDPYLEDGIPHMYMIRD